MSLTHSKLPNPLNTMSIDPNTQASYVRDALSQLNKYEKKDLFSKIKQQNMSEKKMDNIMVITGTKNPDKLDENYLNPQISALTTKQSKGHGTGYMFSKNLVKDLVSPSSSKHMDIQNMYVQKNTDLKMIRNRKTMIQLTDQSEKD